ncbi:MAG: DUF1697 domain-containing protein [Polyangiaceae bacterium]
MKAGLYDALLRGINVGGKNRLPMKELSAIFGLAGCTEVKTYIQSGNVVCKASPTVAKKLSSFVTQAIAKTVGHDIPIVLRTAEELAAVTRKNPFLAAGAAPESLHVMFLKDEPRRPAVAALDAARSPGDEFVVQGREIYLRLPNGVARTKLTNAYFDRALATTSTMRNWRTVLELASMSGVREGC